MRAVLQRVTRAKVTVGTEVTGEIGRGWLVLLGIAPGDGAKEITWLAEKVAHLRAFADADGKMNRDVSEVEGSVLAVSQFTLFADTSRGRRPSFIRAAPPELARRLYEVFAAAVEAMGVRVARGRFGAEMEVELVNDGPMTIWLDSAAG
jgi:D-tyrosyl-tRNA(Tyr) deacylase